MARKSRKPKQVASLHHNEASRKNIPTAEYQSVMRKDDQSPVRVAYERRNRDLDPQLVWRGKDIQDWSDLLVQAPPLFIQEKVHPKALIADLARRSRENAAEEPGAQVDLFGDFNGLPDDNARTEFYKHDANWSNRMILGDSLQVMASLAEREGLRGKVQCIYIDPPYGIKFNSNFQWSTTSHDVKDGKAVHITREPEQVKAFRDTWRDGIHSYLTYLRDRLIVARDLLTESGSVFVQIGDENVHRVRVMMDEVFGEDNFCALLPFQKTGGRSTSLVAANLDYILWYCKANGKPKFRAVKIQRDIAALNSYKYAARDLLAPVRALTKKEKLNLASVRSGENILQISFLGSQDPGRPEDRIYHFQNRDYDVGAHRHWKTSNPIGLNRLAMASRIHPLGSQLNYKRFASDSSHKNVGVLWSDVGSAGYSNTDPRVYVVQTDVGTLGAEKSYVVQKNVVQRCILMTTDPGDLVLDPTSGAGTTAYVAEQWGRRWITIDTSRVALALARARIMGTRYPYYLLSDSRAGQIKEAEIFRTAPSEAATYNDVRQGFVYERVPHITLKSIANNSEIDVIWEEHQEKLEPLRAKLNTSLECDWEEWEVPREADDGWPAETRQLHTDWWEQRIARQQEIDASIAAKADYEYLYDKPYEDRNTVRVAGPFTVESLSPHREVGVDENDELLGVQDASGDYGNLTDFADMILENLQDRGRSAGSQGRQDRLQYINAVAGGSHLRGKVATRKGAGTFLDRRRRDWKARRHIHWA